MNKISKEKEVTPREYMKKAGAQTEIAAKQPLPEKQGVKGQQTKSANKETDSTAGQIQTVTPDNDNGLPGPASEK